MKKSRRDKRSREEDGDDGSEQKKIRKTSFLIPHCELQMLCCPLHSPRELPITPDTFQNMIEP